MNENKILLKIQPANKKRKLCNEAGPHNSHASHTPGGAYALPRRRLFLYRPRYSRRKASSRSISSRVPMVIRR